MEKVRFRSLAPKRRLASFRLHKNLNFKKSRKNGEKRRKPEKISGFSVGIFFVNSSQRMKQPDRDAEAIPGISPKASRRSLAAYERARRALRGDCEPDSLRS